MFIRLKKVFIFFIIPLILAVRIGTSFAELQGYERVNELPSRANELIRKLYGATMPFLSTVQNTVPTIYTLPSGWACIYQSGSTYRVYFNIANSIKYISFAITESGMLELLDDTTPQLGGDLDMNGFSVGGNTEAQLDAAVAANHAQQHSITSASDHTSSATPGQMLMADANGLPVDATNTDNEVSNAVNIVDANYTNWDTAYGWGDHANAGYLTTESDPVFSNSNVATVTSDQVDNWDTAYGWGNHTEAGYLTEESDPVYLASNAANVNATRISDWDTAYGWGNHANVGYLTVETDPIAGALTGIIVGNGTGVEATTDNHTNWDASYGHSQLTSGNPHSVTADDIGLGAVENAAASGLYVPLTTTVNDHALNANVTVTAADLGLGDVENTALSTWAGTENVTTLGTIATGSYNATPIVDDYIVSAANWNSAYGWGNHAAVGYLTPATANSNYARLDGANFTGPVSFNNDSINDNGVYGFYANPSINNFNAPETGIIIGCATQTSAVNSDISSLIGITINPTLDNSTVTSLIGVDILSPLTSNFSTISQATGLYIADYSADGYNIESAGAGSINVFEGSLEVGGETVNATKIAAWDVAAGEGMVYPDAGIALSNGTAWGTSISDNHTNWDTAYGWGDHANAGYLTTESDPVFSNSNVATVTSDQVDNWDTAYGWGNHANVGYLTVETDPIAGALTGIIVGNGTGVEATTDNHTNWDTVYALVNGNAATWTGKADYEFGANNFNGTGNFTTTGTISGVNATWSGKQDVLTDSASLASALGDETGSGLAVFNNSPTLVSPVLGVATGTRLTLSGMASVLSYVNASDQTVANNTTTTVVLDGESYDVGSDFASNTFTAPRSGYYWVGGKIDYSGGIVSGKAYAARIILNGGATPLNYIEVTAYNTSPLSLVIPMRKEYLSASDTLILEAYHIAGVDQLVKKGIGRTWLQVGEATN